MFKMLLLLERYQQNMEAALAARGMNGLRDKLNKERGQFLRMRLSFVVKLPQMKKMHC